MNWNIMKHATTVWNELRNIMKHAIAVIEWFEKYYEACNSSNEMNWKYHEACIAVLKWIEQHYKACNSSNEMNQTQGTKQAPTQFHKIFICPAKWTKILQMVLPSFGSQARARYLVHLFYAESIYQKSILTFFSLYFMLSLIYV